MSEKSNYLDAESVKAILGLLDEVDSLRETNKRLRETLRWYGERARLGRLLPSHRWALSADGGERAREALGEGDGR